MHKLNGLIYNLSKVGFQGRDKIIDLQVDTHQTMSKKQPPPENRPINSIMNLKSNEDLRSYLEDRPELNLSIMKERNGSTLIHFAAFKNQLSKLKIYILHFQAFARENLKNNKNDPSFENQLRAWINVPNSDGMTALHFAGLHGNIEMIQFLERYGANMRATTNDEEDLLFMVVENNHLKALAYLLEHRDGKLPFNPNATNSKGETLLHKAACMGYLPIVAYLLSLPPQDIEWNTKDKEGSTPLMLAVKNGYKDIVKRMLVKGVDRHIKNDEGHKAIDLAAMLGRDELVKILWDDFTKLERCKIACNVKIVYQVQKPTVVYSLIFLILFHLLFLPSQVLAEVTLLNSPYYFYALAGLFYLITMIIFILLTKKHPKKKTKDILELQLPICAECRESIRSNEFHCFICGVCVFRYDHHCPWINNCVSALNVGKFVTLLILLLIAAAEVLFMSLSLKTKAFQQIKPTTLLPISDDTLDLLIGINVGVCGTLSVLTCLFMFNLLGDQCKNLGSNSTSYERAKNLKKDSLLTSGDRSLNTESQLQQEQESENGCISNCCLMLKEKYTIQ